MSALKYVNVYCIDSVRGESKFNQGIEVLLDGRIIIKLVDFCYKMSDNQKKGVDDSESEEEARQRAHKSGSKQEQLAVNELIAQ